MVGLETFSGSYRGVGQSNIAFPTTTTSSFVTEQGQVSEEGPKYLVQGS